MHNKTLEDFLNDLTEFLVVRQSMVDTGEGYR